MSHRENAEFLRKYLKGEITQLDVNGVMIQGYALNPYVDEFESIVDVGKYSYVGYAYWSETGNNHVLYNALLFFAYGRESLLADLEEKK